MKCLKTGHEVKNYQCEDCIGNRECDTVCAKRGLVFGRADNKEPLWEFSEDEARGRDEDLGWFWGTAPIKEDQNESDNNLHIPDSLRWEVWERDNFTCQYCGTRRFLSIDHITPRAKGGETTRENCQTLCKKCNSKKGSRDE